MKHFISKKLLNQWMLGLSLIFIGIASQAEDDYLKIFVSGPDGTEEVSPIVSPRVTPEYSTMFQYLSNSPQDPNQVNPFPYELYLKLSPDQKFVTQRHLLSRIQEGQIPSLKNIDENKSVFDKRQMKSIAHRLIFLALPLKQADSVRLCMNSGTAMPEVFKSDLKILEKISDEILVALRGIIHPSNPAMEPSLNYRIQLVAKSTQSRPPSCMQFEKVDLSTVKNKNPGQKPQKKKPTPPARSSSN